MYPPSLGTENMRSSYPVPDFVRFFPQYLRQAGYYTTNNSKKDYNTSDQPDAWDESSQNATYRNRKQKQPFFAVFNIGISHESSLHTFIPNDKLRHDPAKVTLPPYHPNTPEMRHDWAQYYDKVEDMDTKVGQLLNELEESGEAENTIVFYYSDHGGVLGRSKRFMYESGLHIPMIIRFPSKYAHFAPGQPGTKTDRIVTFLDFAPTVLSLAGVNIPGHMQGKAFLGKQAAAPREYAHAFRGRMDERIDLVRGLRNKKYRYIRNYMPHKIYGQYIEYLWRAPSMQSWEAAYKAGTLNEAQRKFWEKKPVEELFDVHTDPHNVNNLADDLKYKDVLERMRKVNHDYVIKVKDIGFLPEAMMEEISRRMPLYEYARSDQYNVGKILAAAELSSQGDQKNLLKIKGMLNDRDPVICYWGVMGCIILGQQAAPVKDELLALLQAKQVSLRIAAAEALTYQGETHRSVQTLLAALGSNLQMARVQALTVLDQLGPEARAALPAVQKFIDDKPENASYDLRVAEKIISSARK